jgi:hypothetical protein
MQTLSKLTPRTTALFRFRHMALIGLAAGGILFTGALPASAQTTDTLGQQQALLDGTDFNYQYQNGHAIHARFEDGKIEYRWIRGPNASETYKTYPYSSRQIRNDIVLLQWHEDNLDNLITLVVDLDAHRVASSAIVRYRKDKPIIAFQGGTIENLQDERGR